jgi:hypothetical protein
VWRWTSVWRWTGAHGRLAQLGRYEEALVDASECLRIEPKSWFGRLSVARAAAALRRFKEVRVL